MLDGWRQKANLYCRHQILLLSCHILHLCKIDFPSSHRPPPPLLPSLFCLYFFVVFLSPALAPGTGWLAGASVWEKSFTAVHIWKCSAVSWQAISVQQILETFCRDWPKSVCLPTSRTLDHHALSKPFYAVISDVTLVFQHTYVTVLNVITFWPCL